MQAPLGVKGQAARRIAWLKRFRATQKRRWERDGGVCQAVGCYAEGQVHEVKPRGLGGTVHEYTEDEMVTLCQACHAAIHDSGEVIQLRDGWAVGPRGFVVMPEGERY